MPVTEDPAIAQLTQFGEYKGTFKSANGQIVVDFFCQGDSLVGYAKAAERMEYEDITDKWVSEVRRLADEWGYQGHFQLYYT